MRNLLSILATIITAAIILIAASCAPIILIPESTTDLETAWRDTANFRGIPDPKGGYWKSPNEFITDGGGDCEDFSTYLLYLLGPDSGARMAIIAYGPGLHAVVQLDDGTMIEPQAYGYHWTGSPLWTLSYNTVMRLAGNGSRALDNPGEWVDNGLTREMIAECE